MSDFGKNDLAALDRDIQGFPPQEKQRGWWSRNWLWFVPVLLLALVVVGGGVAYHLYFTSVFNLDVCQAAMQKIEANEQLQKELGQPIHIFRWAVPNARVEEDEKDVRWEIGGPKGRAKAHVFAKLMMGKWETKILEVVLADSKKVNIASDDGEGNAQAWKDTKPNATPIDNNKPAPQINMPIPGDIPEAPEKP